MASDSTCDELVFFVNGKKIVEKNAEPEMTLLTFLRRKLGLTGSKLGCAEGGCGACTVMVSRFHPHREKIVHYSINACLAPVCSLHHSAITTVEGIGSVKTKLHPVQERIAKAHGSQCGFCTPGIVMSMYSLLRNEPNPSMKDIEDAFQGNLCRCTGYRPILEGYKTFARDVGCCGAGGKENGCCMNKEGRCNYIHNAESNRVGKCTYQHCYLQEQSSAQLFNVSEFIPLDPTQELIFPPELQRLEKSQNKQLRFKGERVTWIQPSSLTELLDLKYQFPEAKLVVGNTEVGIEMKFKNMLYPVILAPAYIPELNIIQYNERGIVFGAACSLTLIGEELRKAVSQLPKCQTGVFQAVLEQLRWFAGQQIRNVAALGGNIMTASPISDLNPVFMAAGSKAALLSKVGKREIHIDENFFIGYRKTSIKPDEILLSIEIPYTRKGQYFSAFKQASRREDDIAIVTCGMNVLFKEGTNKVKELHLSYGGMAPITVLAKKTCKQLTDREWTEDLLQEALSSLSTEMSLDPSAPGGLVQYRRTLALSLFFKFFLTVRHKLAQDLKDQGIHTEDLRPDYVSATELFHNNSPSSVQLFQVKIPVFRCLVADIIYSGLSHLETKHICQRSVKICGRKVHDSSDVYLNFLSSTYSMQKVSSIDTQEAMAVPGVVTFLSVKDVPGSNSTGPVIYDETVFAEDMVTCVGHIIGAIVADTKAHAQRAAKLVQICYKDLQPVITIQEAIASQSFYEPIRKIERGNINQGFQEADQILEGQMHIGGQEHFYMETHCSLAVPKGEDGEMELFVSTQATAKTQQLVAKALGVPANRIVCRVKRMGGGFGGKESRSTLLSTVVAVAAHKTGRPVRCMLDRDEDMLISGGRHPFLGSYKVGFMNSGQVVALDVTFYSNAGNSVDLSIPIMERALFHMENSYNIPHIRGTGFICKTNLPSNTAFRGFGGPQGMMVAESWISDVAMKCGLPANQVRRINMYKEGDVTPFSQKLEQFTIQQCWEECMETSRYQQRREELEEFNRRNRWRKRGIAIIPTKFGISFTVTFLNQAGALIHVYTDGSVLLTHGGTEMGQGLHTKMVQVASKALGIPSSKIHISETSTNTVPNTSPTAASVSSDLNGMAIYTACQKLLKRLEPYKAKNPKGCWENWVRDAYFDRVSLSATGFYKIPDIAYDFEKNEGKPFHYFSYGVACSEVEIDCLTGDHKNLRTYIVMDVGLSLNPAIDIGQVEGAFMQGVGLFTMEELRYSPEGLLYTRGPGTYKIPGFGDIPTELSVSLLRDTPNAKAIFSSKAVGEPPLFLAASVFYAIKDAIAAARAESGFTGPFRLDSPATPERIRNACVDTITKLCPPAEPGTFTPWAVEV
uniref:Xanthine dehydrogenase/oxidase n=1 Tax=Lepisosteus oculatus TaxID=7918 RepID=W5NFP8_LEPOC